MEPELASIADAQAILGGVSRSTVNRLASSGALRKVNLGRRTFITIKSIRELIESSTTERQVSPPTNYSAPPQLPDVIGSARLVDSGRHRVET